MEERIVLRDHHGRCTTCGNYQECKPWCNGVRNTLKLLPLVKEVYPEAEKEAPKVEEPKSYPEPVMIPKTSRDKRIKEIHKKIETSKPKVDKIPAVFPKPESFEKMPIVIPEVKPKKIVKKVKDDKRRCINCDVVLSRYNKTDKCALCVRK